VAVVQKSAMAGYLPFWPSARAITVIPRGARNGPMIAPPRWRPMGRLFRAYADCSARTLSRSSSIHSPER